MAIEDGSIIVTCDRNERTRGVRVEDFQSLRGSAFFIGSFFTDLGIWEQVKWLVRHWDTFCEKALELAPGDCVMVFADGRMTLYRDASPEDLWRIKGQRKKAGEGNWL